MTGTDDIQTERLVLRPITPTRVSNLFKTKSSSEIIEFFQIDQKGFDDLKLMNDKGMETSQISEYYFLLICKCSKTVMGECGFHTWNIQHGRGEIFYSLRHDKHKNKGFMTEALKAILKFGFKELKLHRVKALVAQYNIPSLRLLERFQFNKEGTSREDYLVNGVYEDSECYSLLKQEWQNCTANIG